MQTNKLLSIVIPTKDRYDYLIKLLELIDSFHYDNNDFEVILQDNTYDNSFILNHLAQKNYSFVKYNYNKEPIPIYLNSDLAILASSGEYVCFIGDDDGVTRDILKWVKWMKENNEEILMTQVISYNWPDVYSAMGTNISGTLSYKPFTGNIITVNNEEVLSKIMARGFVDRGDLPLVYHGITKRSTLDKIYNIGGTFFPGPSPDIANGVALSLISSHYVYIDAPVIISGASKTHGGGVKQMKYRVADIDSLPFLPPGTKKKWEKRIPLIWAGETIWCESAVKALRYMGRVDLVEKVNYEFLYSTFVMYHFPLRRMAYDLSTNKVKLFFSSSLMIVKRYYSALRRLIEHKFGREGGLSVYNGVSDIIMAEKKAFEV